ncbi:MAG: PAS domain S-box protein [Methanoregula sp.]
MIPDAIRVLFVDDDPDVREIAKIFLERAGGFTVDTLTSGRLARERVTTERYDAIISDYLMADMDGITFLKQLRRSGNATPFIIFTGRGREEVVIEALNEGADCYIRKGGDVKSQFAELQNQIRSAVARRRAEDALRESGERYRQFFKTTPDGLFMTAPDGQWVDCNDALQEMFGYASCNEVLAMPVPSFYAHPEERSALLTRVERDGQVKDYSLQFKKKDGTFLEGLITIVPQKNPDGSLKGFMGSVRDISGKKRVDALPADREQFNPGRAENLHDYIIVYGRDGKILYVNPSVAKALEYDAETMVGTPLLLYVAEESRKSVAAGMAVQPVMGEIPLYEIDLIAHGGLKRSVIVKRKPVQFHNNPATLLFLIDITRRKALEDQLTARAAELVQISTAFQQANKKLTLLSTITRHDINNQLTGLIGYLGILKPQQPDPTLTAFCQKAITATERIAAMIRFTREYEEIGITAPAWQDIQTLVNTAAKEAPLGQVMVKNDLPAGREVFADPLVVKVFYNLLDNAVRYGRKITTVRFSVQESGNDQLIVCEDDGDGVPADEKERIFDRGFGKNTGLGLALSREILDITGITIRETGEPGKGARFEMTIPKGMWRITENNIP